MRYGVLFSMIAILVSACGPWPQVAAPKQEDTGAWPALVPFEDLSALSATSSSAQSDAQRLSSRAAALRARARVMRASVPDSDAMDALRARLAR